MTNKQNTQLATINDKILNEYLETLGIAKTLPVEQKKMFLQIAKAYNLNPFKREIYAIPYEDKETGKTTLSIITGYQTYIARANTTGKLNGWKAETIKDKNGNIIGARVTIYRKDWKEPFVWEINRKDFDKGTSTWKTMPDFMTKKVAIAQAFRLAFPEELGGMPYTQEEMESVQPVETQAEIVEVQVNQEQVENGKQSPIGQVQEKVKELQQKLEAQKENLLTPAQLKKIHVLWSEIKQIYGWDKATADEKYKEVLKIYDVPSTKYLTKDKASKLITQLTSKLHKAKTEGVEIPF